MSSKPEPAHEAYDPEKRLTPDEKITLAHLMVGRYKSRTLGADGKMHDDDETTWGKC